MFTNSCVNYQITHTLNKRPRAKKHNIKLMHMSKNFATSTSEFRYFFLFPVSMQIKVERIRGSMIPYAAFAICTFDMRCEELPATKIARNSWGKSSVQVDSKDMSCRGFPRFCCHEYQYTDWWMWWCIEWFPKQQNIKCHLLQFCLCQNDYYTEFHNKNPNPKSNPETWKLW